MAAEKVLIRADEARREILREAPELAYIIDRIKPVDAVEIVRCKDCKHRYYLENGMGFCRVNFPYGKKEDDFCSYGERKDNG